MLSSIFVRLWNRLTLLREANDRIRMQSNLCQGGDPSPYDDHVARYSRGDCAIFVIASRKPPVNEAQQTNQHFPNICLSTLLADGTILVREQGLWD